MARTQKYNADTVAEALKRAHGIYTVAAKLLQCNRETVEVYVRRYATCAKAAHEGRESLLDLAEGKLFENVRDGQERAVEFALSRIGRHRGYGDRVDIGIDEDIRRELARLGILPEAPISTNTSGDTDTESG